MESCAVKKAECQRILHFELWCWKRLFRVLDCRIKPVNPKGNQCWVFIGRTVAETEALILWSPDVKNGLIGKGPDAGKDWEQEEKGVTDDEMVGWCYWLNGHEFEQAPGDRKRQGSLACCSPWAAKVGHAWATVLNGTDIHYNSFRCITQWFSYLICCEMITISLVNIVITPKFFL